MVLFDDALFPALVKLDAPVLEKGNPTTNSRLALLLKAMGALPLPGLERTKSTTAAARLFGVWTLAITGNILSASTVASCAWTVVAPGLTALGKARLSSFSYCRCRILFFVFPFIDTYLIFHGATLSVRVATKISTSK